MSDHLPCNLHMKLKQFLMVYSSNLKIEAEYSSEMVEFTYKTTHCDNREDHNLSNHCCENPETSMWYFFKHTEIMTSQNMHIYKVFLVWDDWLHSE
jgi:hypothetical protein